MSISSTGFLISMEKFRNSVWYQTSIILEARSNFFSLFQMKIRSFKPVLDLEVVQFLDSSFENLIS